MEGHAESFSCCICNLSLDLMNLMQREAHVNECCEDQDSCNLSSANSAEVNDQAEMNPADQPCEPEALPDHHVSDENCRSAREEDVEIRNDSLDFPQTFDDFGWRISNSDKEDTKDEAARIVSDHDFITRLEACRVDASCVSYIGKETDSGSEDDSNGELMFFRNRRANQSDLLSRLKASGKVRASSLSSDDRQWQGLSQVEAADDIPGSAKENDSAYIGQKSPPDVSKYGITSQNKFDKTVSAESTPKYSVAEPRHDSLKTFRCWLCGKNITLGSLSNADHLAFCSGLSRQILDIVLPDYENLATPDVLSPAIEGIDSVIDRLTRVRNTLKGMCPISQPKEHSAATKALPIRSKPAHSQKIVDRRCFLSTSNDQQNCSTSGVSPPQAIPPCPDYKSMPVSELKKLMAKYGYRAGTKAYMVRELTLAWQALHSPAEPAPDFCPPPDESEAELPPRDSFRSPVRARARKTDRNLDCPSRSDIIMKFIVDHERLLEHILCIQPIDTKELHSAMFQRNIPVSLKDVQAFCRFHGLNIVGNWRKPS